MRIGRHDIFPGFAQASATIDAHAPGWFELAQALNRRRLARLTALLRGRLSQGCAATERIGGPLLPDPVWRTCPPEGATLGRAEHARSAATIAEHVACRAAGFGWPVDIAR